MSMAQLVAAGAPELPAGYFYRVHTTSIRALKVEIRKQRRLRSRLVADTWVLERLDETAEESVVKACTRAFKEWQAEDATRAAYLATTAFIGDHDPKGGK
jgi:hypothetical protein